MYAVKPHELIETVKILTEKLVKKVFVLTITASSKTTTASIKTAALKTMPREPVKTMDEAPSLDPKLELTKNTLSK